MAKPKTKKVRVSYTQTLSHEREVEVPANYDNDDLWSYVIVNALYDSDPGALDGDVSINHISDVEE